MRQGEILLKANPLLQTKFLSTLSLWELMDGLIIKSVTASNDTIIHLTTVHCNNGVS